MITQKGVSLPEDFAKVLKANKQALAAFEAMQPSCQKRYVALIEDAKRPETRERSIQIIVGMARDWQQRHRTSIRKTSAKDT